ncbi:hypothetical protein GCM10010168_86230 [Actinoplanes ianthinogenes]|uniref:Transposase n=1 Tax=Actinoplanes ianthinogenes TaxID=122358 RepID=A0ABN6CK37_9ACTN|nr:hypothetical protein [Actinoplanes ianthinogenes]BCJ45354.1 hypothetical protein Aiant_60110 [Actinoplanes ianthinogenes]GGR53973.1 hypothetical protein GCM10010168_86230 [Actinoplanes ianthinogenes]
MASRRIQVDRFKSKGRAQCEECGGPPRQWTRERARVHADLKRHTVRFVIEDTTIYSRKGSS